jgi:hypothetical protein
VSARFTTKGVRLEEKAAIMTFNPDIHHRRSIRMQNFDYASSGAYFVTVCAQGRECLFGEVVDGVMMENDAGRMVARWWKELANKFSVVEPDTFVIMPDHFHGIIFLVGADLCVRPDLLPENKSGAHTGAPLPTIIQWFKTMSTNEYIKNVSQSRWSPFPGGYVLFNKAIKAGTHIGVPLPKNKKWASVMVGADLRVRPDLLCQRGNEGDFVALFYESALMPAIEKKGARRGPAFFVTSSPPPWYRPRRRFLLAGEWIICGSGFSRDGVVSGKEKDCFLALDERVFCDLFV